MEHRLELAMLAQPDDTTCGPTCLHAVYRYYDDEISLERVIQEAPKFEHGGTLAVMLGSHALERGYRATIHSCNLLVFDPTWFDDPDVDLADKLRRQAELKEDPKLQLATQAYLTFLERGGKIQFGDLRRELLRKHLKRGTPILTGLSATYLYRSAREFGPDDDPDDLRGTSAGHFVVLSGYDHVGRAIEVADPYLDNPVADGHHYAVEIDRVVGAIFLGVLTYDANILLVEPRRRRQAQERRSRG